MHSLCSTALRCTVLSSTLYQSALPHLPASLTLIRLPDAFAVSLQPSLSKHSPATCPPSGQNLPGP